MKLTPNSPVTSAEVPAADGAPNLPVAARDAAGVPLAVAPNSAGNAVYGGGGGVAALMPPAVAPNGTDIAPNGGGTGVARMMPPAAPAVAPHGAGNAVHGGGANAPVVAPPPPFLRVWDIDAGLLMGPSAFR